MVNSGNEEDDDDSLEFFRKQWLRELQERSAASRTNLKEDHNEKAHSSNIDIRTMSIEEKADKLFALGAREEEAGRLFAAVKFYRDAIHLDPDVEKRSTQQFRNKMANDLKDHQDKIEESNDVEDENEHETLLMSCNGRIIEKNANVAPGELHLSNLPLEIHTIITRFVISKAVDYKSLLNLRKSCKYFYLLTQDEPIWRDICDVLMGPIYSDVFSQYPQCSSQEIFHKAARLDYNGVFIKKHTYSRMGEQSMDSCYHQYQTVEFYRCVRLLPDGQAFLLTTADEPTNVLMMKLKSDSAFSIPGCIVGRWKLDDDYPTKLRVSCIFESGQRATLPPTNQNRSNRSKKEKTSVHPARRYYTEFEILRRRGKLIMRWISYKITNPHPESGADRGVTELKISNPDFFAHLDFRHVEGFSESINQLCPIEAQTSL